MSVHRKGGRPWRRLQLEVYAEETHCWLCPPGTPPVDQSLPPNHSLARSVDHVIPLAHGGPELERWNLRLAHRICNSRRADRVAPPRHVGTW